MYGLSYANWPVTSSADDGEINATAQIWHGNTVRLQVDPSAMLAESPDDSAMLAQLDSEVKLAEGDGMNVIISAQTENDPAIAGVVMPNALVETFWQVLAAHYASDPRVWFDLFNEPRLTGVPDQQLWSIWHDGGNGYIGMQELVNAIRATGSTNIILAEGIHGAHILQGLIPLTGVNIAYAVHPYFNSTSSPATWAADWGDLASTYPIVADEWSEFASARDECNPNAPTLVPQFLAYLHSQGIGLIAWTLRQPGVLVVDPPNYSDPTSFNPNEPYECTGLPSANPPQGAGTLIQQYFEQYSVQG